MTSVAQGEGKTSARERRIHDLELVALGRVQRLRRSERHDVALGLHALGAMGASGAAASANRKLAAVAFSAAIGASSVTTTWLASRSSR